jgi:hypothetical protein
VVYSGRLRRYTPCVRPIHRTPAGHTLGLVGNMDLCWHHWSRIVHYGLPLVVPLPWVWRLPLFTLAAFALSLRSLVSDRAFRSTVFGDRELRSIHRVPCHVFCVTEMQTGRHAFFSRDFIYAHNAGLGQPADLPLSAAVQFSANFPVAFPYRLLRMRKHAFNCAMLLQICGRNSAPH